MSSNSKFYGSANPHLLSQIRTELAWEGKYDEHGNRREVDTIGGAIPLQKIETINEPRSEAAMAGQLDIFEKQMKPLDDFRNMLIWGDNKLVMASLITGGRYLLVPRPRIYNFRNTRLAHQEKEVTNPKEPSKTSSSGSKG